MPTQIHAAGPLGERSPGLDAAIADYLAEHGNLTGVGVSTVWAGSQAAYDAIGTPDPDTLYFVTG